jgi:hypothetical protein
VFANTVFKSDSVIHYTFEVTTAVRAACPKFKDIYRCLLLSPTKNLASVMYLNQKRFRNARMSPSGEPLSVGMCLVKLHGEAVDTDFERASLMELQAVRAAYKHAAWSGYAVALPMGAVGQRAAMFESVFVGGVNHKAYTDGFRACLSRGVSYDTHNMVGSVRRLAFHCGHSGLARMLLLASTNQWSLPLKSLLVSPMAPTHALLPPPPFLPAPSLALLHAFALGVGEQLPVPIEVRISNKTTGAPCTYYFGPDDGRPRLSITGLRLEPGLYQAQDTEDGTTCVSVEGAPPTVTAVYRNFERLEGAAVFAEYACPTLRFVQLNRLADGSAAHVPLGTLAGRLARPLAAPLNLDLDVAWCAHAVRQASLLARSFRLFVSKPDAPRRARETEHVVVFDGLLAEVNAEYGHPRPSEERPLQRLRTAV